MNCLITSIGSLSAPFVIETAKKMGLKVIGVDIYPKQWIATSAEVDHFRQIQITEINDDFLRVILNICEEFEIKIIIPLTDVDVDFYSSYANIFKKKGIIITISNTEAIEIMRNKQRFCNLFEKTQINVIPTYGLKEFTEKCNSFPCVAKKINGRSSEGMMVLETVKDLELSKLQTTDYVFQPYLDGSIIVADILVNPEKNTEVFVTRKELTRTKNGAGIAVEVFANDKLNQILQTITKTLTGLKGCINVEFIDHNGTYYLMDINPRPSAGVAFSNFVGYNFIENHINVFLNSHATFFNYSSNQKLIITRKYQELVIK